MGLFDLPAPLLAWLDGVLGLVAPPTLRLILWGLIGGAATMALYWLLSPQRAIAAAKADAASARRSLDAYDGEFADAWPLIRRVLGQALRQLRLVLWPALVAALPAICLFVWLSTAYGYSFPARRGADRRSQTSPPQLQAALVRRPRRPPRRARSWSPTRTARWSARFPGRRRSRPSTSASGGTSCSAIPRAICRTMARSSGSSSISRRTSTCRSARPGCARGTAVFFAALVVGSLRGQADLADRMSAPLAMAEQGADRRPGRLRGRALGRPARRLHRPASGPVDAARQSRDHARRRRASTRSRSTGRSTSAASPARARRSCSRCWRATLTA